MKQTDHSPYLPVVAIALGTAAIVFGAVLVFARERQRQRQAADDALADSAEVDATPEDISAANEAGEAASAAPEAGKQEFEPSEDPDTSDAGSASPEEELRRAAASSAG